MTDSRNSADNANADDQHEKPVIRDKRRLDPETGQVRTPETTSDQAETAEAVPETETDNTPAEDAATETNAADTAEPEVVVPDSPADLMPGSDAELAAERLADLQRLQAEYVNYRKRVERDKEVQKTQAVSGLLEAMLPVLDDIALARQHGDLTDGPFAAIAEKLEATLERSGLTRYGAEGDEFDPAFHEALMSTPSADVTTTTVAVVMQPGYTLGERVLRPARVGVSEPE